MSAWRHYDVFSFVTLYFPILARSSASPDES